MKNAFIFIIIFVLLIPVLAISFISFGPKLINQGFEALIFRGIGNQSPTSDVSDEIARYSLATASAEDGHFLKIDPLKRELLYYVPSTGDVKSLSLDSSKSTPKTLAKIKPGSRSISWSDQANRLVANYGDGDTFYDLKTGDSRVYDLKMKIIVLSKDGSSIAYVYFNSSTGVGNISVADVQAGSFKNLLPTRLDSWKIQWLSPKTLSIFSNSLFTLSTDSKTLTQIIENKEDLKVNWSPNGSSLIYSYASNGERQTAYLPTPGSSSKTLPVSIDTSLCAWKTADMLYCLGDEESGDYKNKLISIELEKMKVVPLAPLPYLQANNPVFDSTNNRLYFNDSITHSIKFISL